MRVSGYDRLLSLVVVLYTSVGYSECQWSACGTSAGQSVVCLQSVKKIIVTGGKARWSSVFSESPTNEDKWITTVNLVYMTAWRRKTLGNILWKLKPRRRTALKRSVYDSKLFRKARILEYMTNANGNGFSVTILNFKTIVGFPLRDFWWHLNWSWQLVDSFPLEIIYS